ncbi:MAG: hypothetical protein WKF86_07395 [Acidimicrobiales bacterium]
MAATVRFLVQPSSSADRRCAAFDGCDLVLVVEDEPELDARIGHDDLDAVPCGEVESLGHAGMDVTVEHAPHGVVGPTATVLCVSFGFLLGGDGALYEGHRRAASSVDGNDDVVT